MSSSCLRLVQLLTLTNSAREKIATAELELLSSTSYATSELWTEEGVVRQPGHAKILEMVVYRSKPRPETASSDRLGLKAPGGAAIDNLPEASSEVLSSDLNKPSGEVCIGDLNEACNEKVLRPAEDVRFKIFNYLLGKFGKPVGPLRPSSPWKDCFKELASQPPNLALNVHNTFPGNMELWGFVLIGIALQLVAMGIPAAMTYHWRKPKGATPVQHYAYPTFLVGTCLLVVSIAMCSYIIEETSVEHTFAPTDDYEVKDIFRLQLEQNMGDQPYKAYLILNDAKDKKIRTSRYATDNIYQQGSYNLGTDTQDDISKAESETPRSGWLRRIAKFGFTMASNFSNLFAKHLAKLKSKTQKLRVTVSVVLCLAGFICQFVGLRALHWSATATQLGITILMTCIRAWIRRGVSYQPISFELSSDPNETALSVGSACRSSWPAVGRPWPGLRSSEFGPLRMSVDLTSTPIAESISINDPRIVLREKLQSFMPDADGDLVDLSRRFSRIKKILHRMLWTSGLTADLETITWTHIVACRDFDHDYETRFTRLEMSEDADRHKIHALLALWKFREVDPPEHMCLVKAFSEEDMKEKCSFLKARIKGNPDFSLYSINRSSAAMQVAYGEERLFNPSLSGYNGISIENLQRITVSPGARENHLYGYLTCSWSSLVESYPVELLAGFMDALWQRVNLKYQSDPELWYSDFQGSDMVFDVQEIVNIVMQSELLKDETDAELFVYSSLMRCTKWKDPPDPALHVPTTDRQPNPSLPTATTTQIDTQQQGQPSSNALATASANESPQAGAAATDDSGSQLPPTPSIPVLTATETVQTEKSSNGSATTTEASMTQPTLNPSTLVSSAFDIVQADTDKGQRAAVSGAREHQSNSTARRPVTKGVRAPERGESSRTGAQMTEA